MLSRQQPVRVALAVGGLLLIFWVLLRSAPASITTSIPGSWRRESHSTRSSYLNDINNATLGFEKIFVVGLPSRTDRRDGLALQGALSDLKIDFIDGVDGASVNEKAIPQKTPHGQIKPGEIGCWRAHMNAIREIVEKNISSAIIMEDDADWDVRIRRQMYDLALSTNALVQPLEGTSGLYADKSYRNPPKEGEHQDVQTFHLHNLPRTVAPTYSPYGDDWDLLWLGHCGMRMPGPDSHLPKGRVASIEDDSVPHRDHLWTFVHPFTLVDEYPMHSRVVHHAQEAVCMLGYAVTQKAARAILHELALQDLNEAVDLLYRNFCDRGRNCLGIQPPIINHHRMQGPMKAQSNIGEPDGWREAALTDMTRWSVRLNADNLINGNPVMNDQYPDPAPPPKPVV